jgi:glycosyltransferase EpsD
MSKILFVANIHKHFIAFHIPYIVWLQQRGNEVHVAAGGEAVSVPYADKQFNISVQRSPFHWSNLKACRELKAIIRQEKYDLIHCHTPMGAFVARAAAASFRKTLGIKVLYTAHGFHFYKGAPFLHWLTYYPVEKLMSGFTDGIITINREDYELLSRKRFKNHVSFLVNGVGIDTDKLVMPVKRDKLELRTRYGYKADDFILICVAEYIPRKNHRFIVENVPRMAEQIPNLKVLLVGRGLLMEEMQRYAASIGAERYIEFLGFRKDVGALQALSDVGISASIQEGLPMNIAEALYSGLPVVVVKNRGSAELVKHGMNGFLVENGKRDMFVKYVAELFRDKPERIRMGKNAFESVQKFTLPEVIKQMSVIYNAFLP